MCDSDGRWYLTGVVSWSLGCAEKGRPDVFSNVKFFGEWIRTHTGLSEFRERTRVGFKQTFDSRVHERSK